MLKSLKAPVFSSLDQPYPRYTYQTDLSEAVNLNGGSWAPNGSGMVYHLSCKLVNGASNDRVLYNNSNTATGTRISLVHSLDRVTVIPIEGIPAISFTFPDGTLDANGMCDLWVFVDNARGNVVCTLNGETIQALGSFTPGGVIYYDQITGGGGSNRLEAQLYNIDLFDSSAIQNRWVTKGDEINGYISIPLVTSTDDFSYEFVWQRVDNTLENSDINRMLSYSAGGNAVNFNDSDRATSPNAVLIEIDSISYFISSALKDVAQGSVNKYKIERVSGLVNFYIDDVKIGAGQSISGDFLIDRVMTNGTDYASGFLADLAVGGERFYRIDESPSATEVIDTIGGQTGTRVGMDASNFEFIPNHSQRFRFAELEEGQSILPAQLGDLEIRITSYRAAGFKPA